MREAASFIASQSGSAEAGILHVAPADGPRGARRPGATAGKVATLADFDDHMLADIGLTRRDVRDALDLPFSQRSRPRAAASRASRNRARGWNV